MPKAKKVSGNSEVSLCRPAISPEGRLNQLISMALDLTEERIKDKTASNDLLKEFVRMGNIKSKLEIEKMRYETELVKAKTDAIKSESNAEQLFADAMKAMSEYTGNTPVEEE